ncbi:MAG: DUF1853 family protein [Myxococcales bacterium]|nr:DUF1853 family protein [Myxococcales bacterium]
MSGADYDMGEAYCRRVEVDVVADLRWLLLSPPLLGGDDEYPCDNVVFTAAERMELEAWLEALAQAPQPLIDFLASARPNREVPMRLGRYAERLLAYYLNAGPIHRLVAANLPIMAPPNRDGGIATDHTTLGEIDFLLTGPGGQRLHWELALKYFVARDVEAPGIDDYIGPDSSESFRRKVEKLVRHQVRQAPPPPYDDRAWASQLFVRGQMFYRLGRQVTACSVLAQAHGRGFWVPFAALPELQARPRAHGFVILPRAQWMAPRTHQIAMNVAQIAAEVSRLWQVAEAARPQTPRAGLMIAEVAPRADGQGHDEVARGFVMPD